MAFSNIVLTKNIVQYTRIYYNSFELIASLLINLLEVIQSDTKGRCYFESIFNNISAAREKQLRLECYYWEHISEQTLVGPSRFRYRYHYLYLYPNSSSCILYLQLKIWSHIFIKLPPFTFALFNNYRNVQVRKHWISLIVS